MLDSTETTQHEASEKASEPAFRISASQVNHYCLFKDLSVRIKRSLSCQRNVSSAVQIVMGFDELYFNGGLKPVSVASRKVCRVQRYKVRHYQDLNTLLGQNWHIRIVHKRGDYNYVIQWSFT